VSLEQLWVVVAPCVVVQAFDELVKDGIPEVHPFPPADRTTPAATVLSIAGSDRVRTAGIKVVVDERVLDVALDALRQASPLARPSDLRAFEDSVRDRLRSAIETPDPVSPRTLDAVVAEWGPDIVIAVDPATRRRYADDVAVMAPGQWVKHVIAISRAL
jgi:hypothetical protein